MAGEPLAVRHPMLARAVQLLVTQIIVGGILFAAAGSWGWLRAWFYLGVDLLMKVVSGAIVARYNPAVIAARAQRHKGTKGFDKFFGVAFLLLGAAVIVVAGLDAVRFQWSPLPAATILAGALLQILGGIPVVWAMVVNPFLETTVRIQEDRDHKVIMHGPYRFVRHPMYVGILLQLCATPLILGSAWAFAPVCVCVVLFFWRTSLEDRTLRKELPGYEEHAARTHFRLIPGVW